ncbi:MAG TPA: DUF4381 domain-containing protein, partial [Desulfuromonadales bacterium]|nr:DUF4381 domain-containing protein [Desulfuromonadales bacterium]
SQLPLRDIHLPPAVSWWPLAPGWWILVGLIVLVCLGGLLIRRRRQRSLSPRERALRELRALEQTQADTEPTTYVGRLSVLLRRTCLSCFPRAEVAGLIGEAWLLFLDDTLGERRFSEGPGRALLDAPYRSSQSLDVDALQALCADWIRALPKHLRQAPALQNHHKRRFPRFQRTTSGESRLNGRKK